MSIDKIIGLPVKVSSANRVSLPKEYLRFYGISSAHGKIMLRVNQNSMIITLPEEVPDTNCQLTVVRKRQFLFTVRLGAP